MQLRIDTKWAIQPAGISGMLKTYHESCSKVYMALLDRDNFHIEEDWQSAGEWVVGKLRASKNQIIEKSGVGVSKFYRRAWPGLQEIGLVRDNKHGTILLPKLVLKEDASILLRDIEQPTIAIRMSKLEERMDQVMSWIKAQGEKTF
jgi:hypothetical protein